MPKVMKSYRMSEGALSFLEQLKIYNPDLSDAKILELSLQLAAMVTDSWAESKGVRHNLRLDDSVAILAICRSVELI